MLLNHYEWEITDYITWMEILSAAKLAFENEIKQYGRNKWKGKHSDCISEICRDGHLERNGEKK